MVTRGTQQNLSGGILKEVPVPVPPLPEQRRIARVLSTWDQAITTTERLLANSRKQKQALMQSLLSDKHRALRKRSTLSRKHASEIFAPNSVRRNGDLDLLSVMQDVGVVPRQLLGRKVVMPEGSTEGYKLVEPGDFVISLRSFEGGLEYSRYIGLVSPAYTVLKAKLPISDDFYRHYFKSTDFIGRLAVAVIGIRDGKQISYDDFAFLRLPYPELEEQKAIAAVLNNAELIIQQQAAQLERIRSEKSALMAQLLTGKRRVHLPESESEVAARSAPVFMYPVILTPDKADGGFVVTFVDIPEAITQGDTLPEALAAAQEALEFALDFYLEDKRAVPLPSKPQRGQQVVELSASLSAKLQLLHRGI